LQDVRGLSVVGPGARFCGCLPVAVDDFPGAGMFRNRKVGRYQRKVTDQPK